MRFEDRMILWTRFRFESQECVGFEMGDVVAGVRPYGVGDLRPITFGHLRVGDGVEWVPESKEPLAAVIGFPNEVGVPRRVFEYRLVALYSLYPKPELAFECVGDMLYGEAVAYLDGDLGGSERRAGAILDTMKRLRDLEVDGAPMRSQIAEIERRLAERQRGISSTVEQR